MNSSSGAGRYSASLFAAALLIARFPFRISEAMLPWPLHVVKT